jgi:hypothetical protein
MYPEEEFTDACKALGKNDPNVTELNLEAHPYDSLLDRKHLKLSLLSRGIRLLKS